MPKRKRDRLALPSHYAGVPLGGVGTGCIELGVDARFRNITVNNNRSASTRIPFAPGAFVAIRAACGRDSVTRILQPDTSIPFSEAGIEAPYTHPDDLSWYGMYPASNFRLDTADFPLGVQWSCFSPVIPYDTEASMLPLVASVFQVANRTDETYTVSALFNWENLRGCQGDEAPEDRGKIGRVFASELEDTLQSADWVPGQADDVPATPVGLSFALDEPCRSTAEGNYCLVAERAEGVRVTCASWRRDSAEELRLIWQAFTGEGALPDKLSADPKAYCGSVCSTVRLAPGESCRLVFVLTWYCPVYVVNGEDIGNRYTMEHSSSMAVAEYGLKHAKYFQRAVSNWHQRFLQSSLPNWYSRMLINSAHVFSTNTVLTRDGEFAMMESPQDPVMGMLDRSFYSSIGTLLFFPGFAERELELFAPSGEKGEPGRIYRELGKGTPRDAGYGASGAELMDINAKFILMAYRNYHMTGKTATLIGLYPQLKAAMEHGMRQDRDGDGIPEVNGDSTTFRGWAWYGLNSYVGGLWITAMVAYANLARHLKHDEEAVYYEERARTALQHYERRLWDESSGYYRLYADASNSGDHPRANDGCHSGQLAGAWYADFLNLPAGFSHRRIRRALEAIDRLDRRPSGIAKGYNADTTPCSNPPEFGSDPEADQSWPWHTMAYVACPDFYHGSVDRALEVLKTIHQNVHVKRQRAYNQPMSWDPDLNDASGTQQDRHMGALSIWYSMNALLGFFLSVPDETIWLAPRLPEGVNHLEAPLFTPVAFGWLRYRVTTSPRYRQDAQITFESPVFIRVLNLVVPKSVRAPVVRLLIDEEPAAIECSVSSREPENRLRITLKTPLQMQHPIDVSVEESGDLSGLDA